MPEEAVSATRTDLLLLKARDASARRGLDLLRSKREALVRELFAVLDQAVSARDLYADAAGRALRTLSVALGVEGRAAVESAALAARREIPVELADRSVWGVRLAEVRHPAVRRPLDGRGFAFSGVGSATIAAAREFEAVLEAALRIAAVETRLARLGKETRKATRRINALTEVLLPRLAARMRAIRLILDEREREEIHRAKRYKARRRGAGGEDRPGAG